MRALIFVLLTFFSFLLPGCPKNKPVGSAMAFLSNVLNNYKPIPLKHSCEGANESPQLFWKNLPKNTQSLALIIDDPQADGFIHWIIFNIDPQISRTTR